MEWGRGDESVDADAAAVILSETILRINAFLEKLAEGGPSG